MRRFRVLAAGVLLILCASCAGSGKEGTGTGVGAVLGGAIGSRVPIGNSKIAGIAAGAAIGGFIGNRLGKYLNDQDKRRTAEASARTADTGKSQRVATANGATVTTTAAPASVPTASQKQPVAPGTTTVAAAQECKTVRQTIVLQNGASESEDVTMCKGADGWQPA